MDFFTAAPCNVLPPAPFPTAKRAMETMRKRNHSPPTLLSLCLALLLALATVPPGEARASDESDELPANKAGAVVLASLQSEIAPKVEERLELVVEFEGGALELLNGGQSLQPIITLNRGEVLGTTVEPVEGSDNWRLTLAIDPRGAERIDLRAFLRLHSQAVTETWTYSWQR